MTVINDRRVWERSIILMGKFLFWAYWTIYFPTSPRNTKPGIFYHIRKWPAADLEKAPTIFWHLSHMITEKKQQQTPVERGRHAARPFASRQQIIHNSNIYSVQTLPEPLSHALSVNLRAHVWAEPKNSQTRTLKKAFQKGLGQSTGRTRREISHSLIKYEAFIVECFHFNKGYTLK